MIFRKKQGFFTEKLENKIFFLLIIEKNKDKKIMEIIGNYQIKLE